MRVQRQREKIGRKEGRVVLAGEEGGFGDSTGGLKEKGRVGKQGRRTKAKIVRKRQPKGILTFFRFLCFTDVTLII